MSYNRRIIRTSSYIEIWEYQSPIFSSDNTEIDTSHVTLKEKQKRRKFDELTADEQEEKLKRISKNRKNSKWKLQRLIDCNYDNKTSFLTLTTKENIKDRIEFNTMFDKFIKRLNYYIYHSKKRQLKYIAVLERQKRGAWHAHILLFNFPFVLHSSLLETWGHGAVRINKLDSLDDSSNAGRYVAKYMEKGIGQELLDSLGKKAFYSSRNLNRPEELKLLTNENVEDLIQTDDILYESTYNSKVFRKGHLVNNEVKYRKIKIDKE
ncbi:Rep protein [Streptococcus bovimastitidis]|uniref:Rep protein n=1 Tax=Streptococcus bovimastitidis TaxID=1856638 RepID=A0A1L8MK25_9STRE|nr:Rep protein [Streptococcus bovimastitidis]OJF71104.1 Rep protein [Streptococcus bovimastitidis]